MNLENAARQAALRHGIDPNIFVAQIKQESGFNQNAVSPAGAQGIAQFMPKTAKEYGVNLHDNNPLDDLEGAARYDAAALKQTHGDYRGALSIYNSGRPDGYKHIPETASYVSSILGSAKGGRAIQVEHKPNPAPLAASSVPDLSGLRQQALIAYLQDRHNPDALLTLAGTLNQLKAQAAQAALPTFTGAQIAPQAPLAGGYGTPSGASVFKGKKVAPWIGSVLNYAAAHGWTGTVTSGYRSDAQQTAIYNSGVRPAAVPQSMGGKGSNHEFTAYPGGAVDVTNAAQLAAILARSPYRKRLVWAGSKDPVHFSHPHDGSY